MGHENKNMVTKTKNGHHANTNNTNSGGPRSVVAACRFGERLMRCRWTRGTASLHARWQYRPTGQKNHCWASQQWHPRQRPSTLCSDARDRVPPISQQQPLEGQKISTAGQASSGTPAFHKDVTQLQKGLTALSGTPGHPAGRGHLEAAISSATRNGTGSLPKALRTVPPAVKLWVTQSGWPYFSRAVPPSPPPT